MSTAAEARPASGRAALDISGIAGAAFMATFAVIAGWRLSQTGQIYFAFLVFRDLLMAALFLIRNRPIATGSTFDAVMAYGSTVLPLAYLSPGEAPAWAWTASSLLAVAGFLIATLAGIELGARMGIAPAARGSRSRSGVYRLLRHPMYAGYMIAEVGWVLLSPRNGALFVVSAVGYLLRARAEERLWPTARLSFPLEPDK